MYLHICFEVSDDVNVKQMVEKQLMRLDSIDERDKIGECLQITKREPVIASQHGRRLVQLCAPLNCDLNDPVLR